MCPMIRLQNFELGYLYNVRPDSGEEEDTPFKLPWESPFNVTLKVVGLPEGSRDWGLEINGESLGSFSATALALGVPVAVRSG